MPGTAAPGQAPPAQEADYTTHWGVDSVTHVDDSIMPGDCRTFFKLIADVAGSTSLNPLPQFWGRYLGSPTPSYNLAPSEIPYLASQNCKILLIYAGLTATTNTGENNGIAKANDAISRAQALGVPRGTYIYLNAEPSPDYGFYKGWFNTFQSSPSGYLAGVYGGQSIFTNYCAAYAGGTAGPAVQSMRTGFALLWTSNWKPCNTGQGFGLLGHHPNFAPLRPPTCSPPTVIDQNEGECFVPGARTGQNIDMDMANSIGFKSMWAPPASQFQDRSGTPNVSDVLDWKWIWLGSFANGPEGSYFTTHCPGQWRGYNQWGLGRTSDVTANPFDCPASPSTNHAPQVSASWTNFGFSIPANATILGIEVYANSNYSPQTFGPYIVGAGNTPGHADTCADWLWLENTDTLFTPGQQATIQLSSGAKNASKPVGQSAGSTSCVYGTAGGSLAPGSFGAWGSVTWTPADVNAGFVVSIFVPNVSWAGPTSGVSVLTRNNCNCPPGVFNCPDNKPAELPTIRLGLAVTRVRVYYRL